MFDKQGNLHSSSGRFTRVTGLPQARRALQMSERRWSSAFGAALYREGSRILRESLKQVPVDTGRLRSTGYVSPPIKKLLAGIVVEVGYGTHYAVRQHEDVSLRHRVGKAKYLQDPLYAASDGVTQRVVADMKKLAAAGVGFGSGGTL